MPFPSSSRHSAIPQVVEAVTALYPVFLQQASGEGGNDSYHLVNPHHGCFMYIVSNPRELFYFTDKETGLDRFVHLLKVIRGRNQIPTQVYLSPKSELLPLYRDAFPRRWKWRRKDKQGWQIGFLTPNNTNWLSYCHEALWRFRRKEVVDYWCLLWLREEGPWTCCEVPVVPSIGRNFPFVYLLWQFSKWRLSFCLDFKYSLRKRNYMKAKIHI